jgi:hypothetical protein
MIELTPEQREYKEKTLQQLLANQARMEASLSSESRLNVVRSMQRQLADMDTHINRLQDELSGRVVFDEPVAAELFQKAAQALVKEKYFLAKRHIGKLETIEPFYPGLDRLKQEAESQQVSRRTRAIAAGTAAGYPGSGASVGVSPVAYAAAAEGGSAPAPVAPAYASASAESPGWFAGLFQFHIVLSCLVVALLLCVVFGMAGMTLVQWLIQGSA